jgi:hypothetical protein
MTDSQALRFDWTPTTADWRDAMRAVIPLFRLSPYFAAAVVIVTVVGIALAPDSYPLGALVLGVAAIIAVLPRLSVWAMFRTDPALASPTQAIADDRALHLSTDAARSDVVWENLVRWRQTRRSYVLRTGNRPASPMYVVPRRAFAETGDEQRFRQLLERRIGPHDTSRPAE